MRITRFGLAVLAATVLTGLPIAAAAQSAPTLATPDPAVLTYTTLDKLEWTRESTRPTGPYIHILFGDPTRPGWYSELVRWPPGQMSRPHFHKYDRYITVIKGTWWVGWGRHYDPASTFPLHEGTVVRHIGGGTHYDGAKDEEAIILISGEGPTTSFPNEVP